LYEALATELAAVGLHPRVCPHVTVQCLLCSKFSQTLKPGAGR